MDHRTLLTVAGKSPNSMAVYCWENHQTSSNSMGNPSHKQTPEGIIWIIGQWSRCSGPETWPIHHALRKKTLLLKWVWKPMQMIIFTKPEMVMVLWGRWFFPQLTMIKTRLIFGLEFRCRTNRVPTDSTVGCLRIPSGWVVEVSTHPKNSSFTQWHFSLIRCNLRYPAKDSLSKAGEGYSPALGQKDFTGSLLGYVGTSTDLD